MILYVLDVFYFKSHSMLVCTYDASFSQIFIAKMIARKNHQKCKKSKQIYLLQCLTWVPREIGCDTSVIPGPRGPGADAQTKGPGVQGRMRKRTAQGSRGGCANPGPRGLGADAQTQGPGAGRMRKPGLADLENHVLAHAETKLGVWVN